MKSITQIKRQLDLINENIDPSFDIKRKRLSDLLWKKYEYYRDKNLIFPTELKQSMQDLGICSGLAWDKAVKSKYYYEKAYNQFFDYIEKSFWSKNFLRKSFYKFLKWHLRI